MKGMVNAMATLILVTAAVFAFWFGLQLYLTSIMPCSAFNESQCSEFDQNRWE